MTIQHLILASVNQKFDEFLNKMMESLVKTTEQLQYHFMTDAGGYIFSICATFYIGYLMWPAIMGRHAPDITALFKPLLIAMCINTWPFIYISMDSFRNDFTNAGKSIYDASKADLNKTLEKINLQFNQTDTLMLGMLDVNVMEYHILTMVMDNNQNNENLDPDQMLDEEDIKESGSNIVIKLLMSTEQTILGGFERALRIASDIIFSAVFFGLFVISEIGCTLLMMFGPILFGLSLLESTGDFWARWLMKYLHLTIYPFLAYIVMSYVSYIGLYQVQGISNVLDNTAGDWYTLVNFNRQHLATIVAYALANFAGIFSLMYVPELAGMIFPGTAGHSGRRFVMGAYGSVKSVSTYATHGAKAAIKKLF